MNVLEKMKLNGQLNDIYLKVTAATSVLEKMQLNGQINDIYLKLNAGEVAAPVTPEPTPEPEANGNTVGLIAGIDTRPLDEVKTDSILNPTIKSDAVKGKDAIWYRQGKPDTTLYTFEGQPDPNADAKLRLRDGLKAAKAKGFQLIRYKHSKLQGIYVLQNLETNEVLTQKGMDKLSGGEAEVTPEPVPEITPAPERDQKAIKSAINKAVRAINTNKKASDEALKADNDLQKNAHLIFDDYGDITDRKLHKKYQSKIDAANAKAAKANEKIASAYKEFRDAGGSNDEWDQAIGDLNLDGFSGQELADETRYLTPAELAAKEAEALAEQKRREEEAKQRLAEVEAGKAEREKRKQVKATIVAAIKSYAESLGEDARISEFTDRDVNLERDADGNIISGVQRFNVEEAEYLFDANLYVTANANGEITRVDVEANDDGIERQEIDNFQSLTMTKLVDHLLSLMGKSEPEELKEQPQLDELNALMQLTQSDFTSLDRTERLAKFRQTVDIQEAAMNKLIEMDLIDEYTPLLLEVGSHMATLRADVIAAEDH